MTIKDAQVKDGELCRKEFEAWAESKGYATAYWENVRAVEFHSPKTQNHWETWQASRQPLQSQLAIAREALKKLVATYEIGTNGLFDCLPEYRDKELSRMRTSAWTLALEALKSLSLDNPVVKEY